MEIKSDSNNDAFCHFECVVCLRRRIFDILNASYIYNDTLLGNLDASYVYDDTFLTYWTRRTSTMTLF